MTNPRMENIDMMLSKAGRKVEEILTHEWDYLVESWITGPNAEQLQAAGAWTLGGLPAVAKGISGLGAEAGLQAGVDANPNIGKIAQTVTGGTGAVGGNVLSRLISGIAKNPVYLLFLLTWSDWFSWGPGMMERQPLEDMNKKMTSQLITMQKFIDKGDYESAKKLIPSIQSIGSQIDSTLEGSISAKFGYNYDDIKTLKDASLSELTAHIQEMETPTGVSEDYQSGYDWKSGEMAKSEEEANIDKERKAQGLTPINKPYGDAYMQSYRNWLIGKGMMSATDEMSGMMRNDWQLKRDFEQDPYTKGNIQANITEQADLVKANIETQKKEAANKALVSSGADVVKAVEDITKKKKQVVK